MNTAALPHRKPTKTGGSRGRGPATDGRGQRRGPPAQLGQVAGVEAADMAAAQVAVHASGLSGLVAFGPDRPGRVAKVLAAARAGAVLRAPPAEALGPAGVRASVQAYRRGRPGNRELAERLDRWMEGFEAEEARARQEREAAAAADEGWTLVTSRKGQRKSRDGRGTAVGAVAVQVAEGSKGKKGVETMPNFYRFQKRDKRRDEVLELRKQFERDKRRVQELRASRKFRPY